MFSARFQRQVIVTAHAALRMEERKVSDELLLRMLDDGALRYEDTKRLWAWIEVQGETTT